MQFLSTDAEYNRKFPWACEFDMQCGEQFETMDERDRHEREDHEWNEPEMPETTGEFDCGFCGTAFASREELENHLTEMWQDA